VEILGLFYLSHGRNRRPGFWSADDNAPVEAWAREKIPTSLNRDADGACEMIAEIVIRRLRQTSTNLAFRKFCGASSSICIACIDTLRDEASEGESNHVFKWTMLSASSGCDGH
jgi:hypothetical protein